jgi:hypothetical protein
MIINLPTQSGGMTDSQWASQSVLWKAWPTVLWSAYIARFIGAVFPWLSNNLCGWLSTELPVGLSLWTFWLGWQLESSSSLRGNYSRIMKVTSITHRMYSTVHVTL